MSPRAKTSKKRKAPDPLREDFGPGADGAPDPTAAERPFGAIPCAGEGCFLKPFAGLVLRFTPRIVTGHGPSLARAASSGLEMMKALRDFLDEEIALAERAGRGDAAKVTKIPVD